MSELVPNGQKWSQKVQYGLKWSSMVPNGPKLSTTTKNHDHKFNMMAFITRFKFVLASQTISELMTELIYNWQSCLQNIGGYSVAATPGLLMTDSDHKCEPTWLCLPSPLPLDCQGQKTFRLQLEMLKILKIFFFEIIF